MPTMVLPSFTGFASALGNEIYEKKEKSYEAIQKSATLGTGDTFIQLYDIIGKCSSKNWAGDESRPISTEVIRNSWAFLRSFPIGIEKPNISAESDGAITFEWYRSPQKVLSVSVGPDNRLYYASIIGTQQIHGSTTQKEISNDILNIIDDIVNAK